MKRLVICADGTWNTRDQVNDERGKRRPTNVTKVARGVKPRAGAVDQIVFYHDGLGTGGPLDKFTGGAFGDGIEDNIRVLYRFLIYNWEPGDEIYMFGFSRGAFTVRTLAGFMNLVGLVDKNGDYFVPDLYKCYEKKSKKDSEEWKYAFRHIDNPRPCPPIKFVGVWDTVGSLGAPGWLGFIVNSGKYEYHNVGVTPEMQHCYHAMAIDERRKPFKPTLWERPANWNGTLEQAWFCGVHTNVGGSCKWDGLANEALHWMVQKAEGLGLEFDHDYLKPFLPCFNSELYDSMGLKYKPLGEYKRPIGQHKAHGEMIHQSVLDRFNDATLKYQPENLKSYLAMGAPTVTNTTRVPRGTPCPPLPGD